jgi:hypothetical protein
VIDLLVVGDANPDVLVSGAPETPPAGQAETLVTSRDIADALAWGCACGALSTRAAGGTAARATVAEARSVVAQVQASRSGERTVSVNA